MSKRAHIIDQFRFLKTPPPQLFHKKAVSEQPLQSERGEDLYQHSRSFSTSQLFPTSFQQGVKTEAILDDGWVPRESQTTGGNLLKTKPCDGKRLAISASSLLFLLAASIGLVSNLFLLTTHGLQSPTYSGFRFFGRPQIERHRTLFDSYHGDIKDANVTSSRPKLVIHIGPHKTATTTTQTELTFFQDRLALDNYVYLGRLYHPYSNGERMVLNRTPDSLLQTYFRNMFQKCWKATKAECVKDLRDLLLTRFQTMDRPMPNILISDEALLKLYDDQSKSNHNENFILMKDILGQHFDIVIVVAYRRFYEWLPSAKHQKDKPTAEISKTQWPGQSRAGASPQPLFPDDQPMSQIIDDWSREHFFTESTYATLRALVAPNFRVKVMHMYSKLSVRTNFLCNALPNAPHSCRSSHREDAIQRETRINVRSGENDQEIPRYPGAFFDALATSASSLIDTTQWSRQNVAKMLRDQYYSASHAFLESLREEIASSTDEESTPRQRAGANPWKLPVVCPSKERLDELLHYSLALEARILPKLFRKSSAEHLYGFRYVASNTLDFCWVDTEKALSSSSPWKDHIIGKYLVTDETSTT